MKKIGLVGGISWSSTIDYYRYFNEETNRRLGGLNFAECIIYSVNFSDFSKFNAAHNWDATCQLMTNAVSKLQKAGAGLVMLGANTAHIVADKLSQSIQLPLIDIREVTAKAVLQKGITEIGLLGTRYTMELDFYCKRLEEYNLNVRIPQKEKDRAFIESSLLNELSKGILSSETKKEYIRIAAGLIKEGAQGIILGCTEIPLLITQDDLPVPVFNTTQIHAAAAVEFSLS